MKPLYRRIAGVDVHRMLYVLTVLIEVDDGPVTQHHRSFGGFQRDLRDWVAWLLELGVELVVMESTGSDFQSVYAAPEKAGIPAHVVNAPHVKNVPGRKTDLSDSEWLAQRGRFGLVKPSFIPPQDLGQPRHPLPVVRSGQCRQANPRHPGESTQAWCPARPQEGHHRRGP
jgi:transposase